MSKTENKLGLSCAKLRTSSVKLRQNRLGPPLEVHQMTQGVVEIRIYSELMIVAADHVWWTAVLSCINSTNKLRLGWI